MNRKDALAHITTAGYHGDHKTALRIYTEQRISRQAYDDAFSRGAQLKRDGMRCICPQCQRRSTCFLTTTTPLTCERVWSNAVLGVTSHGPYYSTGKRDEFLQVWGLVFILEAGRGYQAAWTCGEQDITGLSSQVYPTLVAAATAAEALASDIAAQQRDDAGPLTWS
ncbi:hypothetical protein [Pseudomonas gingeri]